MNNLVTTNQPKKNRTNFVLLTEARIKFESKQKNQFLTEALGN